MSETKVEDQESQENTESSSEDGGNGKEYNVIFQPSGRRGKVPEGTPIIEGARKMGVDIESVCGRKQTCGTCKVVIEEGFYPRWNVESKRDHCSPWQSDEGNLISNEKKEKGYRLSCMTKVQGDLMVFIPEESRGGQQVVRKAHGEIKITLDPAIKAYDIEMTTPTLNNVQADLSRVYTALENFFGLTNLNIDLYALRKLPNVLREAKFNVQVIVFDEKEIIDIIPHQKRKEKIYGLAIDVGTTTVAGYLCELFTGEVVGTAGIMNPQVIYGEDVMARITHAMLYPEDGLQKMNESIMECLNDIIDFTLDEAGAEPDDLYEIALAGNTPMHHIILGIDPEPVGVAPFIPATDHAYDVKGRDMKLNLHISGNVHFLANEAGFVGADNCGVLVKEKPYLEDKVTLIIDIGTNGELLLGNKKLGVISCSVPTGPALEGAHIKNGMRATPGAIEKIEIDPKTLETKYKVIGSDLWNTESEESLQVKGICGSGIIDATAEMFRSGILHKSGKINKIDHPRIRKNSTDGGTEYVIAWAKETSIDSDVVMHAADIRAIQLAKGALYCGARIMMKILKVDKVDQVILAGAFGSHISSFSAMLLGMFPNVDLVDVTVVGNSAGDGCRMCLLDRNQRREADRWARQVEYVELTVDPDFQQIFMEAMQIPHMVDSFPTLQNVLDKIPKHKIIDFKK